MSDVFAVQGEIASSIAEALRVALSPAEAVSLVKDRPRDVAAYDLYLKGREHYGRYTDASLRQALELFRQATELDPSYALAWAGMGDCYGQLCQWRHRRRRRSDAPGLEASRRAIALLGCRTPTVRGAQPSFRGRSRRPQAALLRAVEADPRYSRPSSTSRSTRSLAPTWRGRAIHPPHLEIDPQGRRSRPFGRPAHGFTGRGRSDRRARACAL
jgi:tetratricopeptide (TPR) repeat protein